MDQSVSKANIQVLDRASAILRVLTQHHDPVNLKVISDETCLHISTCHRILSDLVRLRFVEKGASAGTYRLGLRFLQLGNLVRERISVRDTARTGMHLAGQSVIRTRKRVYFSTRRYFERNQTG